MTEQAASKLALEQGSGHSNEHALTNCWSLRWVYQHMIEEYARHNGHADLIRKLPVREAFG